MEYVKGLQRESLIYTSCYCEENIWKLCEHLGETRVSNSEASVLDCAGCEFLVLFISNEGRRVVLLEQRNSQRPDGLVVWDYHCVLVVVKREEGGKVAVHDSVVVDFDTRLGLVTPLIEYFGRSFSPALPEDYQSCFRVVEAREFLRIFCSDRSHMIDAMGNYLAAPPNYPPIQSLDSQAAVMNLADFWTMTEDAEGMVGDPSSRGGNDKAGSASVVADSSSGVQVTTGRDDSRRPLPGKLYKDLKILIQNLLCENR
eukprot:Nk52_evm69s1992 gene=Nk52_evmTU69s1992